MRYHIAPLFCRPWTLNGITPRLIESHYENNYGGALHRLNAVAEELAALDPATTPAHVVSRLKQEEMAALNPARLSAISVRSIAGGASSLRSRTRLQPAPAGYCSPGCRATNG
jgi:superoxide dismutase, Fe-Mn family